MTHDDVNTFRQNFLPIYQVSNMPWFYMIIIAMLLAFSFYHVDQMNKMQQDIKYIRMRVEKL